MSTGRKTFEEEYESRFSWRKNRQIYNMKELSEITHPDDILDAFPGLMGQRLSEDSKDALRWSIHDLWAEARECYIFGLFQPCILTCGAVVERCLKLEYEAKEGSLPRSRLTLGKCIRECEMRSIVTSEILELARQLLDPRNDRAHALLEHSEPQLAILGGAKRGIEFLSSGYLIEPYRGDAQNVISATYKILDKLYGSQVCQP